MPIIAVDISDDISPKLKLIAELANQDECSLINDLVESHINRKYQQVEIKKVC
ncbi:hypothetical protein [Maridesulfovibrio hydrothermalis]|uniref:Uncharacterized protein n=1 Tax=Maridesulfovibrio hydrothermalis AM13 = DSM 14728 TaxID=1121451 RepID=L0RGG4_9BACT|nr:hypothetical protein [Maridesulfovibrio hydrothermalis]CCO24661.1 protein of unknown function [Maridesulfovibrio hydrothermalis AM13 = DSM 14728]